MWFADKEGQIVFFLVSLGDWKFLMGSAVSCFSLSSLGPNMEPDIQ